MKTTLVMVTLPPLAVLVYVLVGNLFESRRLREYMSKCCLPFLAPEIGSCVTRSGAELIV